MSEEPRPPAPPGAEKTAEKQPRRRKSRKMSSMYEADYKAKIVKLKNRKCPRCGKNMAQHMNVHRWSCGGCGFTEYIRR